MKKRDLFHAGIAASLLMFFLLAGNSQGSAGVIASGISSTLKEIKEVISGINSFIGTIVSFSKLIGFSTFILFLFILLLSSGLSAIGIPRGKTSFIFSLLIADTIWIIWSRSFNPDSYAFLEGVGRANLVILLPVSVLALISRLFPVLYEKVKEGIRRSWRGKSGSLTENETLRLSEEFGNSSRDFQNSLVNDILRSGNKKEILLSPETLLSSRRLKKLLDDIDRKPEEEEK